MRSIIELQNITRTFQVKRHSIKAVDDVSLAIKEGEIVCLVGESGCGKTTTGKMIAGALAPSVRFITWGRTSPRSPNPSSKISLGRADDPSGTLRFVESGAHRYDIIAAPLQHHASPKTKRIHKRRARTTELVDLTPPDEFLEKFPHQLSGGQRQRVSIARALTVSPSFIVADEAVSMVDVSIRISLLKTLTRLKEKMGLAVLFITHDLALAKYFAWEGRIGVMYLGRMVELAPARQLVESPQHPYTQVLLSAIPEADPDVTRKKEHIKLRSMDVPSLLRLPGGCAFHPRCPKFDGEKCETVVPQLTMFDDGSAVACHIAVRGEQRAMSSNP